MQVLTFLLQMQLVIREGQFYRGTKGNGGIKFGI
jgi:hypothetical protein